MKKMLSIVVGVLTIFLLSSCSDDSRITTTQSVTKNRIDELILSYGSNYSIIGDKMTADQVKNALKFDNISDFKVFLDKNDNSKKYKEVQARIDSLSLKEIKNINSDTNASRLQFSKYVDIEYPTSFAAKINSSFRISRANSYPFVLFHRESYVTGFTLGFSYDHIGYRTYTGGDYGRYEIELMTDGVFHYNVFIEGIGTFYTQKNVEWSVYDYESHSLGNQGTGGRLTN